MLPATRYGSANPRVLDPLTPPCDPVHPRPRTWRRLGGTDNPSSRRPTVPDQRSEFPASMDVETDGRYSTKRVHQRLGPAAPSGAAGKVCRYWRAGNCPNHPCSYLHSELPAAETSSGGGGKRVHHQQGGGALTWRNPNTGGGVGGGGAGPSSRWGRGPGGGTTSRFPSKTPDRPCKYFIAGNCSFGDKCRFLHAWCISDSFSLLTLLQGHEKVVTGIALPSGSDKLYSGSTDQTVRVWDCQTGQCAGVINVGQQVGCMLSEGPWLFVGIVDTVKVWNMQTGTELTLNGPSGQVYALVVGNNMLFAGTQDGRILAWKFSAAGNCFEPAASLPDHRRAVVALVVGSMRLYSGSMDNTIRVWDMATLQCMQTISDHTSVVMSLLCWDQFLISCSLDQTIKVWVTNESGIVEVTFVHNEQHGVLTLSGMHDAQSRPVLLCSLNDNTVRLYDLPSFGERGKIFSKEEIRSIQAGPGGLFFTGDGAGELKVWKWLTERTPAS